MSKPNKYRRKLNRMNQIRKNLVEITSSTDAERMPLKGFDHLYEITRNGDIFSKRLLRFIKHKFISYGDDYSTYIEFQVNGESHKIGIGKAVADSYLSEENLKSIVSAIPQDVITLEDLKRKHPDLPSRLASVFGVTSRATFFVIKEALLSQG